MTMDSEDVAREISEHLRSLFGTGTLIRNAYPGTVLEFKTRDGAEFHVIVREGRGSDRGPVRVD